MQDAVQDGWNDLKKIEKVNKFVDNAKLASSSVAKKSAKGWTGIGMTGFSYVAGMMASTIRLLYLSSVP